MFLGTGSATPSKLRANSSIFLKIPMSTTSNSNINSSTSSTNNNSSSSNCSRTSNNYNNNTNSISHTIVVLDVGEGACRQLFQSCSGDMHRYYVCLLQITVIWISHAHSDHMIGFPHLIQQIFHAQQMIHTLSSSSSYRHKNNNKILVFCPSTAISYLQYCVDISNLDDLIEFISISDTLYTGCTTKVSHVTNSVLHRLTSVYVPHCKESYAVVLEIKNLGYHDRNNDITNNNSKYYKFVYSGDCRPCQALVTAGYNCDLLIHEATFNDACYDHAVTKRHSTTSEALSVAKCMKAKHVILTHFSQRYAVSSQINIQTNISLTNSQQQTPVDKINDDLIVRKDSAKNISSLSSAEVVVSIEQQQQNLPSSLSLASTPSFAVAFDFLKFSYPSHMKQHVLDIATRDIAQVSTLCHSNNLISSSASFSSYSDTWGD